MLPPGAAELAVFVTLGLTLALFVAGPWRYDLVAMASALGLAVLGIIPGERLFVGFAHPAVITVAAILVVSRGLQGSGVVEVMAGWLYRVGDRPTIQLLALCGLVAVASAFMNNVGALALFLPVTIRLARTSGVPPSVLLMPLAFASLLGGMATLIGTPPNIIVATFREEVTGAPFGMFDFAPVGVGVTVAGVAFIALLGWRLLPPREGNGEGDDLFSIQEYMTEVRIPEGSPMEGKPLAEVGASTDGEATVVTLVRGNHTVPAPSSRDLLRVGDVLVLQAGSDALSGLADGRRFELAGPGELREEFLSSDDVSLMEVVVRPDSPLLGRSATSLNLRLREGVNVLAVARRGSRITRRLGRVSFEVGDVLLLQLRSDGVQETLDRLGCLPLARRELRMGQPRRIAAAVVLFAGALALTVSGILPVTVAFTLAALAMVLVKLVPLPDLYRSVDWPVIVLLAAMIPVGEALEGTGGAARIAGWILASGGVLPPAGAVGLLLVGTMFLSDLVNNAAAVVLMAPIAITVAAGLGASPDPFLMAVAVGGSSAFLTPIGHQSNILVMGPGGYRFGDYWRMGLPLEVVTLLVALPLILWAWPL